MARRFGGFCWSGLLREARGQEIAEAALVLPIVFMVLIGIFWFGQAFRIYGTLAQAARVGAQAAANPSCTTCAGGVTPGTNACNAVQATFRAAHLDMTQVKVPNPMPAPKSCITGNAFTGCDPSPCNVCVQAGVVMSSTNGTTGAGVCGVSVSFQYPYQFWFPGTSLNNQQIQLQGGAVARSETH